MTLPQIKTRYYLIDALRGLAVIAMVLYHALWDLVMVHRVPIAWFASDARHLVQRGIRIAFLLLSGFSFCLGKRHWHRGLVILLCGGVVWVVTHLVMPQARINFGVLMCLGCATLLTALLHPAGKRLNPYIGLVLSVSLFVITLRAEQGYFLTYALPRSWYANDLTAYLGFPHAGFFSADYVPLIPWLFVYWTGYFAHGICEKNRWLPYFAAFRLKPLEFVGRHALVIYMAHQPLVYGLLWLVFFLLK